MVVRNEENGDLLPSLNCAGYLIAAGEAATADRVLTEYLSALSGKVTATATTGARLVLVKKKLVDLQMKEDELENQRYADSTDAFLGRGDYRQRLQTLTSSVAVKQATQELLEEEKRLDAAYMRLAHEATADYEQRIAAIRTKLGQLGRFASHSDRAGYCRFSQVLGAEYVFIAIPADGMFYWRKKCTIPIDDEIFCGPEETTTIHSTLSQ